MKNRNSIKLTFIASLFAFANLYGQDHKQIISDYLNTEAKVKRQNITKQSFVIISDSENKNSKGSIVNIQQTINDIPVYGAISSVLIKNDKVSYYSDKFIDAKSNQQLAKSKSPKNTEVLFASSIKKANININPANYIFKDKESNTVLSQLVYFPLENNELQLAYVYNFFEEGTNNYWNLVIDANTEEIIDKSNLTVSCNFNHNSYSQGLNKKESVEYHTHYDDFKGEEKANHEFNSDNASYRVFAFPIEAPTFGQRTLENNPWYLDASPIGWQNDGTTAYNITRGNNVYAYTDKDGSNAFGDSANGGASNMFDFPLDLSKGVDSYTDASITNLFYASNKMHDIFYRFGFDEAGRNFQAANFGKGEEYTDEDPVLAEARDGSGVNNANFATPPDGFAPRMQMYLWNYGYAYFLKYNTPADMVDRQPLAGYNSDFGGAFPIENPITGDIVLANPINGCTDLDNTNLEGKIALIERGSCNFDLKFRKAQDKGAKAVIIYNPTAGQAVGNMTGTDTSVSIPGLLVNNEEGELIKSKIFNGENVNVNLQYKAVITETLDGSLDNGIIAHEYTHGISTRSTGNGYSCLNPAYANEQMGEGWSDFFALMVTNKANATKNDARGMGTYASQQNTDGLGIRPSKYSTDFTVNSYTYGDTNGMMFSVGDGVYSLDVHSIGFVWGTMLWDLHWKFAEKYGFSNDIANNPNSGSAKVVQLVMDGMKLQGCLPSFVNGRDAIIAADNNLNNGENKCMIWETFAKRGLGVNASPGKTRGNLPEAISDQVEDFTIPTECENLSTGDISKDEIDVVIYPNPASQNLYLKTNNKEIKQTKISIYDFSGKIVLNTTIDISKNENINISNLANGIYVVKGEFENNSFIKKIIVKK